MANVPQDNSASVTSTDANNNCAQKSYSLRPRLTQKRVEDIDFSDKKVVKSRSRNRGRQQQQAHPPLSKYRRKTANARERSRMREINEAFETLRRAIPQVTSSREVQSEKLTKISTLRSAMDYISALHRVLQGTEIDPKEVGVFNSFTTDFSSTSFTPVRDHSISPPPYPSISFPAANLQQSARTTDLHDLSLTPSEITDHSLSSTSDVSELFLISIDFDSLSKDPVLHNLAPSVTDRTFSTAVSNLSASNFQDQCSVFDEVMFLTNSG